MTYRNVVNVEDRDEQCYNTYEFNDYHIEDGYMFIDFIELAGSIIEDREEREENMDLIMLKNLKAKELSKKIYREIKKELRRH